MEKDSALYQLINIRTIGVMNGIVSVNGKNARGTCAIHPAMGCSLICLDLLSAKPCYTSFIKCPISGSFYPVWPAVQPYQFSAVLAFDLQNRPFRLRPLIVQNALSTFRLTATLVFQRTFCLLVRCLPCLDRLWLIGTYIRKPPV